MMSYPCSWRWFVLVGYPTPSLISWKSDGLHATALAPSMPLARAGANGVYNSSWEGLLPALFASWLKIYEMIWNDMTWHEMIWNYMIWNDTSYTLQEIGDFWHFFNSGPHQGADVAQLRPLEATVEDAEIQLCQNLEGFLVSVYQRFSASKILVVLVL